MTVQFSRNYNANGDYGTATWLPFTAANINIRSEACPIPTLTVSYGAHDVCYQDLALLSSSSTTQYWTSGSTQALSFNVKNQTSTAVAVGSKISFPLPTDISYIGFTGTNWSCSTASGTVTCTYSQTISASSQSSALNVSLKLSNSPSSNTYNLTPTVSANTPDNVTSNNALTFTINALNSSGVPASCTNPQPGLLVRFFDTQGYTPTTIATAAQYEALVNSRGTMPYLMGQTIVSNINGSGNPFDPNLDGDGNPDYFLGVFEGYIYQNNNPNISFAVDGDDAIESWVDGNVVSAFYGAHGPRNQPHNGSALMRIGRGFSPVQFRIQEIAGGDVYRFYWSIGNTSSYVIIPNSAFYHCTGNPNIQLTSAVNVLNDPVNGTTQPKAIPGAVLQHTVNAQNIGNISTDRNSTSLVQAIDSKSKMYVGGLSAASPVIFNNGTGNQASGLSYTFTSLASTTDSIAFSTNGTNFTYTPVADVEGYDANITHFRLTLGGSFKPTFSGATPTFNFIYQVRID